VLLVVLHTEVNEGLKFRKIWPLVIIVERSIMAKSVFNYNNMFLRLPTPTEVMILFDNNLLQRKHKPISSNSHCLLGISD